MPFGRLLSGIRSRPLFRRVPLPARLYLQDVRAIYSLSADYNKSLNNTLLSTVCVAHPICRFLAVLAAAGVTPAGYNLSEPHMFRPHL